MSRHWMHGKGIRLLALLLCLCLCAGCAASPAEDTETPVPPPAQEDPEPEPEPEAPAEPVPPVKPESQTESETAPPPEPEPEPLPLEGHIICLDPGHCVTEEAGKGYREPVSPLSDETKPRYLSGTRGASLTEEQLNLQVALKLRDALEALGAEVVMTREVSEISLPNTERCRIANESGADVHVHIHADGSESTSANGVSVLIPDGDLLGTPSIVEESARLGQLMVDCVSEATGAKNRGTVPRSDLTGLNFSEIPSVFIEMGFMTNPEEDALLSSGEYQDKIVAGMANSLLDWYGAER
ncbi:MAG: N-acetylmuramoyl-L-alanine amidase [Oscillospiraceae bacterium]|jgi:N-acetylmuramoyl-L-alanine amidase|nr:N-acetylmuramoyl-L-alanine amidase [Oscillospiraceae bacterium]